MANIGDVRNQMERFHDRLLQGELPTHFVYNGVCIGDASPAAIELFMNGEEGARFYLPPDSYCFGLFIGCAWNMTDNDAPSGCRIDFGIENDNGTVAFAPTNLSGTDGNPITARNGEAGTFALAVDSTNDALRVNFTPTANDTYLVTGTLQFAFAARKSRLYNPYRQTN